MAWSTPDLSDITQVLKGLLDTAVNNSTLPAANIKVLCDSPDTARQTDGHCHLNLYLLHVGRDPFWRNTPVAGPRPQLNSAQPLSLNLSYLLTAWCDKDFVSEQRAMTIALQAIHSQPIVTHDLIASDLLTAWLPNGEFLMSIEADALDEMSRLWQAFTVPMRLSALVKVGVVFIAPATPTPPPAIPPSTVNLAVSPEPMTATVPMLMAGFGEQSPPVPADADPSQVTATIGPLVAVGGLPALGGGTLVVAGNGLDLPAAADVFLSVPGTTTEWKVTSPWRQNVAPGELELLFPAVYADPATSLPAPPNAMPLPGLYNLAVGAGTTRSNTIPIAVAPRVDDVVNPPILPANAGGFYAIAGAGFVPAAAATTLGFGGVALTYSAAATPAAGEFTVDAAGEAIVFLPPAATPPGSYPIQLAVNGISASTGWVVVLT
jgi:Pvc16 N-terminal domain